MWQILWCKSSVNWYDYALLLLFEHLVLVEESLAMAQETLTRVWPGLIKLLSDTIVHNMPKSGEMSAMLFWISENTDNVIIFEKLYYSAKLR